MAMMYTPQEHKRLREKAAEEAREFDLHYCSDGVYRSTTEYLQWTKENAGNDGTTGG